MTSEQVYITGAQLKRMLPNQFSYLVDDQVYIIEASELKDLSEEREQDDHPTT